MHLLTDFKIFFVRLIALALTVGAVFLIIFGPGYCKESAAELGLIRQCHHFRHLRWNFYDVLTYAHLGILSFAVIVALYNFLGFFCHSIFKYNRGIISIYVCVLAYFICGLAEIALYFDLHKTYNNLSSIKFISGKVLGHFGAGIVYFIAGLLTIYDSMLYKIALADKK
uniref:MARVEL domain-containing protein n=1 Tax=Strongyloides venezuelensis TaxID=75913 RepID=A0A0K0G2C6_STRVS